MSHVTWNIWLKMHRGPLRYRAPFTLIPAWISNYIHYKMWYEITYPFPNYNSETVEVWEWISNFIPASILISQGSATHSRIAPVDGIPNLQLNRYDVKIGHQDNSPRNASLCDMHHSITFRIYMEGDYEEPSLEALAATMPTINQESVRECCRVLW